VLPSHLRMMLSFARQVLRVVAPCRAPLTSCFDLNSPIAATGGNPSHCFIESVHSVVCAEHTCMPLQVQA
jgi:hypothetical protein